MSEIVQTTSFSFVSAVRRSRHDVFLSFRGEDTRHNITPQIHKALIDAGIPTFKDDINLQKGDEIATELLKAIQMSRIAIIIFSRNYATSGWCLDELVKIVECQREGGQIVVPIFYDVDPCEVENQTGSFAQALKRHEERFEAAAAAAAAQKAVVPGNKLRNWKRSLTEAAREPGWDLKGVDSWNQSKFITEIVQQITNRHQDAHLSVSIHPPKIDTGIEYLNLLLSVISDDVLIIGICGIDKTSIAKAVYNENFQRFKSSCYIGDVSSIAEQPNGLLALQKQFVSEILMVDDVEIEDAERGKDMIKDILRGKRVLIVLDNVNKLDHLNVLARKRDWFGSGSRIIITTKDSQLLNVLEVDDVYGDQGIQVIEDEFHDNLVTISSLEESIQRYYDDQEDERVRFLMTEIERERKKSIAQERMIASMGQMMIQRNPLHALTFEPQK